MTFLIILVAYFIVGSVMFGSFPLFLAAQIHMPKAVVYSVRDLYRYIKYRKWRTFNLTGIIMYGGLFGTGKTFNIVNFVCRIYKKYDNIEIYSNVTLNTVPYIPFRYFEQLSEPVPEGIFRIYVCDEFGSLFNSRNYNNTVLTEKQYTTVLNQLRKEKKLLLISTQRYGMVDKMFRQVCREWRECRKLWRFMWFYRYDPYALEYSYDPRLVKPFSLFPKLIFATDKKRAQYNTYEFINDFENPISITDRSDDTSLVKADFGYNPKAKTKYIKRSNKK